MQQGQTGKKAKAGLGQYHPTFPTKRVHYDIHGPFTPSANGSQYVDMIVYQMVGMFLTSSPECRLKVCGLWFHFQDGLSIRNTYWSRKKTLMVNCDLVCDLLQIFKTRTTAHRPCSNGPVEHYNRTLLQLIRCFLKSNQTLWDEHFQQLAGTIQYKLEHILQQVHNLAREMLLLSEMHQKRDYMRRKWFHMTNPGKKGWWKKSLVEKMAVERSRKKAWWTESLVCFGKDGKKAWCLFFRFDTYQD